MKRVPLDGDVVILRVKEGSDFKDVIFVRSPTKTLKNVWEPVGSYDELLAREKV